MEIGKAHREYIEEEMNEAHEQIKKVNQEKENNQQGSPEVDEQKGSPEVNEEKKSAGEKFLDGIEGEEN